MSHPEVKYTFLDQGQSLNVTFLINGKRSCVPNITDFNIADIAQVRFKFDFLVAPRNRNSQGSTIHMLMSCKKCISVKNYAVKLNIKVQKHNYSQQFVCAEDWSEWIEVGNDNVLVSNVAAESAVLEVILRASKAEVMTFAKLYNDTITTDINLSVRGSNNVLMHRNCLLAHSDFFKALFQTGDFVDKKDFVFGQKYITEQTIHDLKDYVYLGVLPDAVLTGLYPLLLLARCYLFDNLMSECIMKIAQTVTPESLHDLMRFACENNMPELGIALLQTPHEVSHQAYLLSKKAQKRTHEEDSEIPKKRQRTDNDVE